MECTVWNERHRTRLACRRPGAGARRDIERGKCRAQPGQHASRRKYTRVSTRTVTKKTFRNRVVLTVGYVYTSIHYCCKSFPVLLHDVMVGGWIASYVFIFIFGLGAAAFRVDRARRGNLCLEDQAKACFPTRSASPENER